MQSTPAFDVNTIEADWGSALIVEQYMHMVIEAMDFADVDLDISYAIAAAGHLNKIPVSHQLQFILPRASFWT